MKGKRSFVPTAVGGSSLLVIFGLVCFALLGLLCLNTALAQERLSQRSVAASLEYYQADLEAQRCFARLRAGEAVEGVTREGDICRFSVPVSRFQTLYVTLQQNGSDWKILQWQTIAQPETVNETLPLWTGQEEVSP